MANPADRLRNAVSSSSARETGSGFESLLEFYEQIINSEANGR